MGEQPRGFVLILCAPSGGGKGTLANSLTERFGDGLSFSVSTTTRKPRPGEVDGEHYFFVDKVDFQKKIKENAFLEWAEVFGNFYGTSRSVVEGALDAGKSVLLDIDWQGARQIRENIAADDVVSVFIFPPSKDTLHRRLVGRGQDSAETITRRMAEASDTLSHWRESEYLVINDDLAQAKEAVTAIFLAERSRRRRMIPRVMNILNTFELK